ncbi:MAG: glycosyltransferase family 2 protein [Chlamydiota bacterium]
MSPKPATLSIVVPCLNEEEILPFAKKVFLGFLQRLIDLGKVSPTSRICFIDDGSKDSTWFLIQKYQRESERVQGIKLSRNFGHQNALLSGLFSVGGDVVVTIDVDLQDDILTIEKMLDRFYQGHDIVYGVRRKRDSDTFFKRSTSLLFYRLMRAFGCNIIHNHADFRLLSRKAIHVMRGFSEVNLFLRGIVPFLGFRSSCVYYDRAQRYAGKSKYSLKKMAELAFQGITSFSVFPLKVITVTGFFVFLISFAVGVWALLGKLHGKAVAGWLSTVVIVAFFGGIQIFSIGIIGEYIGKIYGETKRRPRFIIDHYVGFDSPCKDSCEPLIRTFE